jgi:hypothetical protein
MGIKQVELVPINTNGPTTTIPAAKPALNKVFQVSRTDTAATLKAVLPAQSSVLKVLFYGGVASDAATTATVTITLANNSGTISTGTVDVKANGATTALVQMSNLPNIESLPPQGDIKVNAQYAETGGASTVGGPWKMLIEWV